MPKLVGMTVQDARIAWKAAGFRGSFKPGHGQDTAIVDGQNPLPGTCLPATASMVVTYS